MDQDTKPAGGAESKAPIDGPEAPGDPVDQVNLDDLLTQLANLAEERDKLAAEKSEAQDRFLRRSAEFDNFRRRAEKEKIDLSEYAGMETVRGLLAVLDDFDRALKIECSDKDFQKGIELIYQRLFDSLKKQGLEPIETEGKSFDPNLHHAIEMAKTEEAEDQAILAEFQRGYNFKGRLLRPAMVKVAVRP